MDKKCSFILPYTV